MIRLCIERLPNTGGYEVSLSASGGCWRHAANPPYDWQDQIRSYFGQLEDDLDPSRQPQFRAWHQIGSRLWHYFFEGAGGVLPAGRALQGLPCLQGMWGRNLALISSCPEVLAQPWEYLKDNYQTFLFRDHHVGLLRSTGWGRPRPPAVPPLKVLVCLSCPADRVGFNTLWCQRVVESEWAPVCGPYAQFAVEGLAPTGGRFLEALENYDVVYFLGHGEGGDAGAESGLVFCQQISQSPTLASSILSAPEIAARVRDARCRTKLLVLSACLSSEVAARILSCGGPSPGLRLPNIMCMEFRCPVGTALHFHKIVFPWLLFGYEQGIAGAVAKWRCNPDIAQVAATRDHPVWGVPTVFSPIAKDAADSDIRQADRLVETSALVASASLGPTNGPIGLSPAQRIALLGCVAKLGWAHLALRTSLETCFDATNPQIPYQPDRSIEPFEIDIYPVTNHLYDYYREHVNPQAPDRLRYSGEQPDHPAQVTYQAACVYCAFRGGRLPTRVEWERAARGASSHIFPWGDALNTGWRTAGGRLRCNVAEAGIGGPQSVFACGPQISWHDVPVYDLIGNIPEWTGDQDTLGRVAVMGAGYKAPLAGNIPSYWRFVDPLGPQRYFGFRCAWPVKRASD